MRGLWRITRWLKRRKKRVMYGAAERAVAGFPRIREQRPHGLQNSIVVSLTSYPPRFPYLDKTIKSLLDQTVKADHTLLWIAVDDIEHLPETVRSLTSHGLQIKTCEDIRSYKKIIPALEAFPEATIVTADDDVYYKPDWLEGLVELHKAHPRDIVSHRAHLARADAEGRLVPYMEWLHDAEVVAPPDERHFLFPVGVGGILYPPASLHSDVTDGELFGRLSPAADDVWLYWMAKLKNSDHVQSKSKFDMIYWEGSQDETLYSQNMFGGENDIQIRRMEDAYGTLPSLAT